MSCSARSACTAVGFYDNGSIEQTLIESWNGSVWSIVPSPNPSASRDNALHGVSCNRRSECTAVGTYDNAAAGQTLVESLTPRHS